MTTSLKGYFNSSSFLIKCFLLFFVMTCSTINSLAISFMYLRMNRGSQSSEAIPRSLQQRIRAFDLQPSVAVGMPSASKYCCSPRAIDTSLAEVLAQKTLECDGKERTHCPPATRAYSLVTSLPVTMVSLRGTRPQPPGPKALFKILLYLISGR